jgi:hypothetical protein
LGDSGGDRGGDRGGDQGNDQGVMEAEEGEDKKVGRTSVGKSVLDSVATFPAIVVGAAVAAAVAAVLTSSASAAAAAAASGGFILSAASSAGSTTCTLVSFGLTVVFTCIADEERRANRCRREAPCCRNSFRSFPCDGKKERKQQALLRAKK